MRAFSKIVTPAAAALALGACTTQMPNYNPMPISSGGARAEPVAEEDHQPQEATFIELSNTSLAAVTRCADIMMKEAWPADFRIDLCVSIYNNLSPEQQAEFSNFSEEQDLGLTGQQVFMDQALFRAKVPTGKLPYQKDSTENESNQHNSTEAREALTEERFKEIEKILELNKLVGQLIIVDEQMTDI